MFRALVCSLALGLLVAGVAPAADETYALKLYQNKKGDKSEHETSTNEVTTVTLDVAGMNNKIDLSNSKKDSYKQEILEKKADAHQPTKLTRTYTVSEKTEKDKTTKAAYAGETVLIERKGDEYTFTMKGEALTKDDAPALFKQFNKKKDDEPQTEELLPKGPIKVGESWKVDAATSAKQFKAFGDENMKFDTKKSTIEGKLLKVYKKDGAQFGTLELTLTAFLTEISLGEEAFKTKPESKVVLKAVIDTCIDGTVQFEDSKVDVTIDISADLPNNGSIVLKGTSKVTEKIRAGKK